MGDNLLLETLRKAYGYGIFETRAAFEAFGRGKTIDSFRCSLHALASEKKLAKTGKGFYCLMKESAYGPYLPGPSELFAPFLGGGKGMVIGYELYLGLSLTTQIPKNMEAYTSAIDSRTKTIDNVRLMRADLNFTPSVKRHVAMMEVLSHLGQIEDLNLCVLSYYVRMFAASYSPATMARVLAAIKYKEAAIVLLKGILDFYGIVDSLPSYGPLPARFHFHEMDILRTALSLGIHRN